VIEKAVQDSGRFFEKKLRKKLLTSASGAETALVLRSKSLLRSFSTEKRPLSFTGLPWASSNQSTKPFQ
jgi:hypothetical protein